MRSPLLLLLGALLLAPSAVLAQDDDWEDDEEYHEPHPTGGFFGASLTLAEPRGEFAQYVDGGIGGELNYVHRLDRDGWFALRVDGGFLVYGYERQRVPLSETIGGRILVDLETSNNIAFIGVGPQIGVPNGHIRPYANAYVGYSYLFTQSTVEGTAYDEEFAATTNFDDWTPAHGFGAGVYIPIRGGYRPISIDIGMKYRNNGVAEYLREGDIQDNDDGSITLFPVRSDTDLMTFHIGFSIGISR